MRAIVLAMLGVCVAQAAHAESIEAIVTAKLAPALPEGLGIAHVYPPASFATLDVAGDAVAVEMPRELRVGRASVRVVVRDGAKKPREAWVQVSYAALVEVAVARRALAAGDVIGDDDIAIERRAADDIAPAAVGVVVGATLTRDLPAGGAIGAHDVVQPPPLPRGSQVTVDVRRGGVHVHGTGTLELAARPGQPATVRLSGTSATVRGILVAPATVEVGGGA